ncbi:MAG: hypothetical protein WKG32_16570 [Gemmatimonadaceae bacterium]
MTSQTPQVVLLFGRPGVGKFTVGAARTTAGGGALRLVELRCDSAELERRLASPSRERFGKLRDVSFYRRLDAEGTFDRPRMPAAELIVDTGAAEPAEAARRIAEGPSLGAVARAR